MTDPEQDILEYNQRVKEASRFGFMLIGFVIAFILLGSGAILLQAMYNPNYGPSHVGWTMPEARAFYLGSCASCHGANGEGGPLLNGPALNSEGQAWRHSDAQIIDFMRKGNGPMPGLAVKLGDAEAQSVVDFIKLWWTEEQKAQQPVASE